MPFFTREALAAHVASTKALEQGVSDLLARYNAIYDQFNWVVFTDHRGKKNATAYRFRKIDGERIHYEYEKPSFVHDPCQMPLAWLFADDADALIVEYLNGKAAEAKAECVRESTRLERRERKTLKRLKQKYEEAP